MVQSFGSQDEIADGHYCACPRSNAFNLHSKVTVPILLFVPFLRSFRLTVAIKMKMLSTKTFPAKILPNHGARPTRMISSIIMSPYQLKNFHLINSSSQLVTIFKKLVPVQIFSQMSHLMHFFNILKIIPQSLFMMKDSGTISFRGGVSPFVWLFLRWSFLIGQNKMKNTFYLLLPLFLFHCWNRVAKNFTFNSDFLC